MNMREINHQQLVHNISRQVVTGSFGPSGRLVGILKNRATGSLTGRVRRRTREGAFAVFGGSHMI